MRPVALAGYLFLAVIWGLSFLVLLKVVIAFGWAGGVALRGFVAGGTLLILARAIGRKLDFSAGWRPFAVVGATTVAAQQIGLALAMPRIGTAMAAIFMATIPLFSMVISQLWGIERLTARTLTGLLLGLGGIMLLVGFPAVPITLPFLFGCASAVIAAISAAFGSNYASRHMSAVGSWEATAGSFLFGGVFTLPFIAAVPIPALPGAVDVLYLFVAGALMSGLAYVIYFRLVTMIGPTRTISVEFAVTVVAVVVGAFFLGERLTAIQIAGASIVICGCAMVLGLLPWRGRGGVRSSA